MLRVINIEIQLEKSYFLQYIFQSDVLESHDLSVLTCNEEKTTKLITINLSVKPNIFRKVYS